MAYFPLRLVSSYHPPQAWRNLAQCFLASRVQPLFVLECTRKVSDRCLDVLRNSGTKTVCRTFAADPRAPRLLQTLALTVIVCSSPIDNFLSPQVPLSDKNRMANQSCNTQIVSAVQVQTGYIRIGSDVAVIKTVR